MYVKMVITGVLIRETATHYVTETSEGINTYSKQWYRLSYNN